MTLVDLTLLYPIKDKQGNRRYRVVGTENEVFLDSIEMLPVENTFILPPYIRKSTIKLNHQDKTLEANGLLIGKKAIYKGEKARVANYCRIK